MTANDTIRIAMDLTDRIIETYLGDLSDADILLRAVPGMNHIAWQLGHLISSERRLLDMVKPGSSPALPEGFDAVHERESAAADATTGFRSKSEYLEMYKAQRAASRQVLDSLTAEDFDRKDATFPSFVPTVGSVMNLVASHPMMHCGQFVAVRRKLGKPVTI
jgi:hypothetical protein